MKRKLHKLAHARAGDKGDTLTLALFPYRDADYELLRAQVTAEAVKRHLAHAVLGEVRRYELPNLPALQFVCERALDTGVTTSLAIDPHGKTMSYALLEFVVEVGGGLMSGPLDGVRILDLTTVVMGPYATQILADFGADVIKVEPPEGDVMRHTTPARSKGMGHIFMNLNRNKRSVVLDLKRETARAACLAIAKNADVLVYNIRPQAMARLNLGYDAVRAANPRIIYVGAFGYSQRGPYAARAAYDDLIQGATGIPWLLKEAGADVPRYIPATLADRSVGLHIVNAVCAALYRRETKRRSGDDTGQRVDVPMFESMLQTVMGEHMSGHTFVPGPGEKAGSIGYARMLAKERRPYRTSDGYVCVLVYTDKQWRAFFELIGRPELAADPDYATPEARSRGFEGANALVAAEMTKRSTAEWLAALERADIPVQRMNSLSDIVEDPHLGAIGYFREVEHPSEGPIRTMAVPSEWSESAPEYRRHAPRIGEHTREVLREAGMQDDAIEQLIASGSARAS